MGRVYRTIDVIDPGEKEGGSLILHISAIPLLLSGPTVPYHTFTWVTRGSDESTTDLIESISTQVDFNVNVIDMIPCRKSRHVQEKMFSGPCGDENMLQLTGIDTMV